MQNLSTFTYHENTTRLEKKWNATKSHATTVISPLFTFIMVQNKPQFFRKFLQKLKDLLYNNYVALYLELSVSSNDS